MDSFCCIIGYSTAKNCFVGIPSDVVSKRRDDKVTVFEITLEGKTPVYCSWSGDTTLAESKTLSINGLYADKLGIPDGKAVNIKEVNEVVECHQVQVEPLSVDDWEILEIHSSYVESHLLDQVRVVWTGQVCPIWVNKSICIFVKIGEINPPSPCALLVNNTEVIVNPKMRPTARNQNVKESRSSIGHGKPKTTNQTSPNNSEKSSDISQSKSKEGSSHVEQSDGLMSGISNYIKSYIWTTNDAKATANLTKSVEIDETSVLLVNFKIGFRVQSLCLLTDSPAYTPPSVVFIQYSDFVKKLQFLDVNLNREIPEFFYAKICKLKSPAEKSKETASAESEKTKKRNSESAAKQNDNLVAVVKVIIVKKYDVGNNEKLKPCQPVLEGHMAVSDYLRRQLKLDVTGQVQIEPVSHHPDPIEALHLFQISNLPPHITCEMILQAFRCWLDKTLSYSNSLLIFQQMLIHFPILPELNLEVLLTFDLEKSIQSKNRDYSVLNPHTCDSIPILIRERVKGRRKWPEISHLPCDAVTEIDPLFPKLTLEKLGGIVLLASKAMEHIDMTFGLRPLTQAILPSLIGLRIGALLVTGISGTGKSSLGKALCRRAAEYPYLAYTSVVECKSLKGKRPDSIQRILEKVFEECTWREPSVILLDDVDVLAGASSSPDAEMSGEALYSNKLAQVIQSILKREMVNNSRLSVIMTAKSRSSIHPSFIPARGIHQIQQALEIKTPKQEERSDILAAILRNKSFLSQDDVSKLPLSDLSCRMEGFVAQDIKSVVDRAIHAHHNNGPKDKATLTMRDFDIALTDFTPASYRNVKLYEETEIGWQDIGGLADVKKTLIETLQWPTKYPQLFANCPLRLRSGLLLFGAPGTGKTLLARAVAKECGLNFISIKGPELLSKYIGASEQAVRDVFNRAQSARPCILFFDEFDSIAPRRGHDSTGVTDRVVNQLLTQLDGVEGLEGVYVLGATSRPDLIDPALLRPGRLDKSLHCQMPTENERLEILTSLAKKIKFADDVNLEEITKLCEYFTGADFKALLYNAQLEAIHEITPSLKGDKPSSHLDLEKKTQQVCQSLPSSQKSSLQSGEINEREQIQTVSELNGFKNSAINYIPNLEEGPIEIGPDLEKQIFSQVNVLEKRWRKSGHQTNYFINHASPDEDMSSHMVQVNQSHLVKAANRMGPSVSAQERMKYERIYSNFVSSRGEEFDNGSRTSGKRLTLA